MYLQICALVFVWRDAFFSDTQSGEQGDAALLASWYGWLSEICSEAGDFRCGCGQCVAAISLCGSEEAVCKRSELALVLCRTAMRAQQKGIHLRSLEKAQQRRAVT